MDSLDYSDLTARVLDGEALRIGELYWTRPDPPLLPERAQLVMKAIPRGTLAAGITAGWVWTGMGLPTPLSLIARAHPAPSPLVRHQWKVRGIAVPGSEVTSLGDLVLLTPEATVQDVWTAGHHDDVAAAQLYHFDADLNRRPDTPTAHRRAKLVTTWRSAYPWATRYTS